MRALTCDACGGNSLTMTDDGQFSVCDFCGTKHTLERIRVKVQEIKGVVEITKGNVEKERLLKNAETFFSLNERDKAYNIYCQITEDYPDEYRGWFGLLTYYCKYCTNNPNRYYDYNSSSDLYNRICDCANATVTLTNDKAVFKATVKIIKEFFDSIAETNPYYYVAAIIKGFDKLKAFKTSFADINEEIKAYEKTKEKFDALTNEIKQQIFIKLWPSDALFRPVAKDYYCYCTFVLRDRIGLGFSMPYHDSNPEEIININGSLDTIIDTAVKNYRMNKLLCAHCGGSFRGLFKQTCAQCGKPKDY